jgi:23S rRNA pseudouridine1911/1915/1917 synthase
VHPLLLRPGRGVPVTSHIPIPPERIGMELDEFLCLSFPLLNKGFLRRQVREGRVLVDGNPAVPSQHLRMDQVLFVDFDDSQDIPQAPVAPAARIPVLYEDDLVLAVDKPPGLAVEPERWARSNASVAGALLELALDRSGADPNEPLRPEAGLEFRPRILHRLDKDTSGVLLVAKTVEAERRLRAAFDAGEVEKTYLALVEGEHPLSDGDSEVIDLPIGPDERKSGRMRVDRAEGKPSQTRITVAQRFQGYTLLACQPLTGRTHQIRVHLREIGFPLAVDPSYGRRNTLRLSEIKRGYRRKPGHIEPPLINRLTLHALSIEFPDPSGPGRSDAGTSDASQRRIRVEAPLPRDFERALKQLAKVRAR